MKKAIYALLLCFAVASSVVTLGGCGENGSESASSDSSSQVTTSAEASADSSGDADSDSDTFDIKSLQMYDADSDDPFSGAWHITDGEGSPLESFVYIFDGSGKASIVIDNMGHCGSYSVEDVSDDGTGEKTFNCQLMFGINGNYYYEFSDSGSTVVLTDVDSELTTTIEKLDNVDFVPTPENDPIIDSDLLGAWMCDSGEYLYFDESGIMYYNQFGTVFTYYTYSAEDGKITATYTMQSEATSEFTYYFEDDTLIFDDLEFTQISVDELDEFDY
ncbi:MAG: hypothetical protein LUF33_05220 [Clostridiales bacterium]|nr:hypothetical protein [Clostridiales bacterium]